MIKSAKKPKIIVAMSGGVDSSLSAAFLKETGDFSVKGVFVKLYSSKKLKAAEISVKRVAKHLKIPLHILDFRKDFERKVINPFLKEYKKGFTPNPCVICNEKIKFGLLFKKAEELGADFVATGHYARIKEGKELKLLKAKDPDKDQSYFLWQLSQKHLLRTFFPLGGYKKKKVKEMAKMLGLSVSDFSHSQEICFIDSKIEDFLARFLRRKPGKIINREGKTIGRHKGLWYYTIGQRKGLELFQGPFYVIGKDLKKNILIVSKNVKDLLKKEVLLKDVNWVAGKEPKLPLRLKVKIRYGDSLSDAVISKFKKAGYKLKFKNKKRAAAAGQSAVFYKGKELLGGGLICY